MCTYLTKRGATYYFRRTIPAELRPLMEGRAEFMVSLRTKDRDEAKRLIPAETTASQGLLDDAARRMPAKRPNSPRGQPLAPSTAHDAAIWEAGLDGAKMESTEVAAKDARRAELSDFMAFLTERLRGSTAELPRELRAFRYILEDGEFKQTVLRERMEAAHAEKLALERSLAGPRLEPAEGPASKAVIESGEGIMLDTHIIDRWAAERKVVPKGKDAHRAVARWFYERVGRKPVTQITKRDVLAFKDALVAGGQTLANIRVKLSRLRTLLKWAADNELVPENVAAGIDVKDTDKARNKRLPFDLAALTRIFASPVYNEGARPVQGRGEAAYWLPLLALFTGARMEELGQLRPGDVQQIGYPDADGTMRESWFIRITEDAGDNMTLKNAGSERDVPVHPELERLGFIRFAQAAKQAGQQRLFPALKPDKYGRLTAKWGEWFGPYIRGVCGVTDTRMVFHSFRHTFKDYARHAGMAEGVQRQIMGHSSGDVADQYGSGYPLHALVAGTGAYRVPGLKLP